MTRVEPFHALRYDARRVELARVIVPPYDVVTPRERLAFYDRDPHNAIRLELTRDPAEEATTDYAWVRDTLEAWRRDGTLVQDGESTLTVLRQEFEDPSGRKCARIGFFAALGLEDYERGVVLPHERTLRGPKADRLKMLRATRANLSPVFMLYEDREDTLASLLPAALEGSDAAVVRDDSGITHTMAPLRDPEAIARIRAFLDERPVVIADGHHRYETALAYRDERRAREPSGAAPYEFTLAYFANAYAEGSLLLPIHRVILEADPADAGRLAARLPAWTHREVPIASAEAVPAFLDEALAACAPAVAFAADDGGGTLHVFERPAGDELSIRVIHGEVLQGAFGLDEEAVREGAVAFPKSASEAARLAREPGHMALYLNPLSPDDVFRVTGAGEVLPQKSTFFYPKLPSGLVFRPFDEETP